MLRRGMAAAGVAAALSVGACGGGQNAAPAGVSADSRRHRDRALGADRGRHRVRRDAQVAALDHRPAADRRTDHADSRQVRRSRPPGRAADADRSAPPAGGGVEPGSRARRARGGRGLRAAAGAALATSSSRPAPSAGRSWSRPRRRCAPPRRTSGRCSAQVQQQEVQLRYFTVTAPTAGIVGDVPVRVGNQVTPQTVLTTIDQNETLELYVPGADRARRRAAERAADCRSSSSDGTETLATTTVELHLAARRRSDAVGAREGAGPEPGRHAARVAVRPRAHRLEDGRRAGRAGDRGPAHQRPVLRVRRRGRRRQAGREAARDQGRSDRRRQLSGARRASKPASASSTSGAQKLADGAPIQAAPDPASPAQPPAVAETQ